MKEGLFYRDTRTEEILKCETFTRSSYLFRKKDGTLEDRPKTNHYKRVTSKRTIAHYETGISFDKKPVTRKERVAWMIKKFGPDAGLIWAAATDREVKQEFESLYDRFKNKPDYVRPPFEPPVCLICKNEVFISHNCSCGENEAVLDEEDPAYLEHLSRMSGESI